MMIYKNLRQLTHITHHTSHTNKKLIVISTILLFSSSIFANFHRFELDLTGGAAFSRLHNINNVVMTNVVTNTYNTTPSTQTGGVGGLGFSADFQLSDSFIMTVGPAFYYIDFKNIQGIESPFSNAGNFDTLNYQFSANSVAFTLQSRIIYSHCAWQPYIVGGIGDALNSLYNYSEVPTNPNSSASPALRVFGNNSVNSFAYDVGAGIQHRLFVDEKHHVAYSASLDYRYFNFGTGKLSPSVLETTNQALKINTLNTQAVLFSIIAAFH